MKTSTALRQSVTLLGTLALALLAGAAQAWTVTADPAAGPPGSQVTVSGQRFPPNSPVEAFLQWRKCSANTDAQGNFTCRLVVPKVAQPGPAKIWIVHRPSRQWFPAAFTVRTDWGTPGFDGGRTGYNPYENVLNHSNVGQLKPLWFVGGELQIVADGRVFVEPADGSEILALNKANGQEVWRRPAEADRRFSSSLVSARNRIYTPTQREEPDGHGSELTLSALATADGSEIWTSPGPFVGYYDHLALAAPRDTPDAI